MYGGANQNSDGPVATALKFFEPRTEEGGDPVKDSPRSRLPGGDGTVRNLAKRFEELAAEQNPNTGTNPAGTLGGRREPEQLPSERQTGVPSPQPLTRTSSPGQPQGHKGLQNVERRSRTLPVASSTLEEGTGLQRLREELQAAQGRNRDLEEQLRAASARNNRLQQQLQQSQNAKVGLSGQVQTLEQEKEDLRRRVASLERDVKSLKLRAKGLTQTQQQLQGAQEQLEKVRQQPAVTQGELATARRELEELRGATERRRQKRQKRRERRQQQEEVGEPPVVAVAVERTVEPLPEGLNPAYHVYTFEELQELAGRAIEGGDYGDEGNPVTVLRSILTTFATCYTQQEKGGQRQVCVEKVLRMHNTDDLISYILFAQAEALRELVRQTENTELTDGTPVRCTDLTMKCRAVHSEGGGGRVFLPPHILEKGCLIEFDIDSCELGTLYSQLHFCHIGQREGLSAGLSPDQQLEALRGLQRDLLSAAYHLAHAQCVKLVEKQSQERRVGGATIVVDENGNVELVGASLDDFLEDVTVKEAVPVKKKKKKGNKKPRKVKKKEDREDEKKKKKKKKKKERSATQQPRQGPAVMAREWWNSRRHKGSNPPPASAVLGFPLDNSTGDNHTGNPTTEEPLKYSDGDQEETEVEFLSNQDLKQKKCYELGEIITNLRRIEGVLGGKTIIKVQEKEEKLPHSKWERTEVEKTNRDDAIDYILQLYCVIEAKRSVYSSRALAQQLIVVGNLIAFRQQRGRRQAGGMER